MTPICYSSLDSMNFPRSTGVYIIFFTNSENSKVYVGSAAKNSSKYSSENGFKHRWVTHLSKLRAQKHHSVKLQNAYNKYKEENLRFEIIELCNPLCCLSLEGQYILKYDSYQNGYNSRPEASGQLGYRHRDETKEKMKAVLFGKRHRNKEAIFDLYKQKKNTKEIAEILNICHNTVRKVLKESNEYVRKRADYIKITIYQYDLHGALIKEHKSICEAAAELGINESQIRRVLKNQCLHTHGYFFAKEKLGQINCLELINKNRLLMKKKTQGNLKKSFTPERLEKMRLSSLGKQRRGRIKNIKQLDLDGKLVKLWDDSKQVVEFFKLKNFSPVLRVIKGQRQQFRGYKWTL